jgi:hypothetical protein
MYDSLQQQIDTQADREKRKQTTLRRVTVRRPEDVKLKNVEEERATAVQDKSKRRESSLDAKEKVNVDSFEFIGLLGQGSYGSVYMAKKKSTGKFYAIKII